MDFSGSHPWAFPGGKVPRGRGGGSPSGWGVGRSASLGGSAGALRGKVTARRRRISETHAFPGFRHPRRARVSTPALSTVAPEGGADIRGRGGAGFRVNQRSRPFRDLFQRSVNFSPKAEPTSFHKFKGWQPQVRGPRPRGFRGQGRGQAGGQSASSHGCDSCAWRGPL